MSDEKQIWYAILKERCNYDFSTEVSERTAYRAGARGWHPIFPRYGRTDITRQGIAEAFLQFSKNPKDTLVMFDIDHDHSNDTVPRLVAWDVPIVVPLMFRRGEPYEACAFTKDAQGELHHLAQFPERLLQMNCVGSGAIAIQRQVFTRLMELGHEFFWKYEYLNAEPEKGLGKRAPSEDLYFSKICDAAGIEMYVDATLEAPHLTLGFIDKQTHLGYMAEHLGVLGNLVSEGKLKGGENDAVETAESNGGHSDTGLEQPFPDLSANLVH